MGADRVHLAILLLSRGDTQRFRDVLRQHDRIGATRLSLRDWQTTIGRQCSGSRATSRKRFPKLMRGFARPIRMTDGKGHAYERIEIVKEHA
jgi:hypothetical protein